MDFKGVYSNESTNGLKTVGNGFLNFIYFLGENCICIARSVDLVLPDLSQMHLCAQCIMGGD